MQTEDLRALVLSGGGAKGAYEAGVVSTLLRDGERFDIVCGTSIGAMNAAMIAQNEIPALTKLWHTIASRELFKPHSEVEPWHRLWEDLTAFKAAHDPLLKAVAAARGLGYAFTHLRPLFALRSLRELTGVFDHQATQDILNEHLAFASLQRVLLASACNLTAHREDTFYAFPGPYARLRDAFVSEQQGDHRLPIQFDEETFAEYIRASGAVPCAFSPVHLTKTAHYYVDGAVTNNAPISQAIDAGARDITIVYVDPPAFPDVTYACGSMPEIMLGCLSVMRQRILDLDYEVALRLNEARAAGAPHATKKHHVRLRKIRPDRPLNAGLTDFKHQSKLDADFETGKRDARSAKRDDYAEKRSPRPKSAAGLTATG